MDIVFLSGARTPFGTFGGALKDTTVVDFTVVAAKAAIQRSGVAPTDISQAIFGNVIPTTADSPYFARHVALKSGAPIETPALTINRLCGSGFQAVVSGAEEILLGHADVCLVGGGESMSQAPHMARGIRWGVRLGTSPALADSLWESLTDAYAGCSMGETAENLATRYNLDRGCADEFALRSQQLTAAASFADEIVPVPVKGKAFDKDEHPRPDTTLEGLGKLKPVFREGGVVTAGNASGIGDGAAALVIASDTFAKSRGLKPLARLVSWGLAGVDPTIMGIGPVPAAQIALKRAGRSLSDIDLIEINEAFAAQTCAVERELQIPREKLNVHGGAIALSHPLAASGARITTHLIYALRRAGKRWGLGAACIGGGQGIAVVIESLS